MGKLAFVFPGQGAQTAGMGIELYEHCDGARKIFDLAGEQVKKLSFEGPQDELSLTVNAQPCIFTVNLACAAALSERGISADGAAGFSLGEVSALAYCGLMSVEQALGFVQFRAEAMHKCALESPGGMFAIIGFSPDTVVKLCSEVEGAYPANFNCESQTVVSCREEAFAELTRQVAAHGGKAVRLATSGAFHSPLMNGAKAKIAEYLETVVIGEMKKPIYSNVTGKVYGNPKELIAGQVNRPVLWQKTIENMILDGFDTFVEAGPGKVLTSLIKKISGGVRALNVCDLETLEKAVELIGGKNA